jgi:hypothetical protein
MVNIFRSVGGTEEAKIQIALYCDTFFLYSVMLFMGIRFGALEGFPKVNAN